MEDPCPLPTRETLFPKFFFLAVELHKMLLGLLQCPDGDIALSQFDVHSNA